MNVQQLIEISRRRLRDPRVHMLAGYVVVGVVVFSTLLEQFHG